MLISNSSNLAKEYGCPYYSDSQHDLIAEAYARALETFDPRKGEWQPWFYFHLKKVQKQLYAYNARHSKGYYEEKICAANNEDSFVCETVDGRNTAERFFIGPEQVFNAILREETKEILAKLFNRLKKTERKLLKKRYREDKTIVQTACELETSKSTADRTEKSILAFFLELLSKKNLLLNDLIP